MLAAALKQTAVRSKRLAMQWFLEAGVEQLITIFEDDNPDLKYGVRSDCRMQHANLCWSELYQMTDLSR